MGVLGSPGTAGQIGETPYAQGGFRRVSPLPEPLALARMRKMFREVAIGGAPLIANGLAGFAQWKFLAALAGSDWSAGARRDSGAARRLLQRRLRALGTRPMGFADADRLAVGSPVHLSGVARARSAGNRESHIWVLGTIDAHNVRLMVEEGHDFFLTDPEGRSVCVITARGHIINARRLRDGDRVSVFGYIDRVVDARAQARTANARVATALAVRSGDAMPLLVRREHGN